MAKAYKHQQSLFNKTSFFPLLCRTSKKDVVKLSNCRDRSSSSSSSDDPSSPKVSCIGQIRRTNKVVGFSSTSCTPNSHRLITFAPTKTTIITAKTHSLCNYTMLRRRWFSGRNVGISVASTSTTGRCGSGSGGGSSKSSCSSKINHHGDGNIVRVDVDDLDPPLPVVIKNVNQTSEVNLWERRCGGRLALKSLEPISR